MKLRLRLVSVLGIIMILLVGILPGVIAEDYTDNNWLSVDLELSPYADGDYTANYADESTILKSVDEWEAALPDVQGSYVGSYEKENLLEIDYLPPVFDADSNNTSNPPDIFTQQANVYFCVRSEIAFSSEEILSGSSHLWVRVPTALRSIADTSRGALGYVSIILQITNLETSKVQQIYVDDPKWPGENFATNVTDYDDRLYIELFFLILPEITYRFEFFAPLQTDTPDLTTDPRGLGAVKPSVYLTAEDVYGVRTNLKAGVLTYDDDKCSFFCNDSYSGYGGFDYNVSLDAGWSFIFVEGVGEGMYGREVSVSNGSYIELFPTISPSSYNSHVTLYLPFICDEEISYRILMRRLKVSNVTSNHEPYNLFADTSSGQWVLENGSAAPYDTYWYSNFDCDGDGYTDYPDLKARDFIAITSRTLIVPYSYLESSLWHFKITFLGDYDITFLCLEQDSLLYMGNATRLNRTSGWDVWYNSDDGYLFQDRVWFYAHLTNETLTQRTFNASGYDSYSYPHFYTYQERHHYGEKVIYVSISEQMYIVRLECVDDMREVAQTIIDFIRTSGSSSEPDAIIGLLMDTIDLITGGINWLGVTMYKGIKWLSQYVMEGFQWIYRGVMSFIDAFKIMIEVVTNVLSIVFEFLVILVSLAIFFGAIILYNKLLMVIRDALYKFFSGMSKMYTMVKVDY